MPLFIILVKGLPRYVVCYIMGIGTTGIDTMGIGTMGIGTMGIGTMGIGTMGIGIVGINKFGGKCRKGRFKNDVTQI